jgi:hypothetical protein
MEDNEVLMMLRLPKKINFYSDYKLQLPFYSHTKTGYACGSDEQKKYWLEERKVNDRIFSNLWPCNCDVGNSTWASTEHYFQMFKYSKGDQNFMQHLSTGDVASFGQVSGINPSFIL